MRQERVGLILQARFGSTRLRGKALECVAGVTVLEHCLRRLMLARAGRVVLATTNAREDDGLVEVARGLGCGVYRGGTDDVLGRYLGAALTFGFDIVIRATGDNPCVDIGAPRRIVRGLRRAAADYVSEQDLPYGGAVEAMSIAALGRAAALATSDFDREHVTPYIRQRPETFRHVMLMAPEPVRRPDVRVTVDTPADLAHVRQLFEMAQPPVGATTREPSLAAIINAADSCVRSDAA
jgi:spore coat polysaccharide biosynthesis protein SpsF